MGIDSSIAKATSTASRENVKADLAGLFDQVMAENGPGLLRLAGAFAITSADRDDLFQDIVLAVWQALPNFRGESSLRTYVFRIAHNRAAAYVVSRRLVQTTDDEQCTVADPRLDPERLMNTEQERQLLLDAVCRLPFIYRNVIALALEGLNYREIADVLGVSETNIGARLNRARSALRALLESKV